MQTLDVRIDRHPEGPAVVTLKGPLDAHSAKALRDQLDPLVQTPPQDLVLDLAGVDYVASSGAMLIITLSRQIQDGGGRLVLVRPKSQVMVIFTLLGIVDLLTFVAGVPEALAALK